MDLALLLSSGMKLLNRLSQEFVSSSVNLLEEVHVEPTEEVEHVLKARGGWGERGRRGKTPPICSSVEQEKFKPQQITGHSLLIWNPQTTPCTPDLRSPLRILKGG